MTDHHALVDTRCWRGIRHGLYHCRDLTGNLIYYDPDPIFGKIGDRRFAGVVVGNITFWVEIVMLPYGVDTPEEIDLTATQIDKTPKYSSPTEWIAI